jgi:hypothetical protein
LLVLLSLLLPLCRSPSSTVHTFSLCLILSPKHSCLNFPLSLLCSPIIWMRLLWVSAKVYFCCWKQVGHISLNQEEVVPPIPRNEEVDKEVSKNENTNSLMFLSRVRKKHFYKYNIKSKATKNLNNNFVE